MGKTAYLCCLYKEGEVINDIDHPVFACARQQSYRFVLTPVIGTITVANMVEVMIASKGNWISGANYMKLILRLKKRDIEAAEYEGAPAQVKLTHMSDGIQNRHLDERNKGDT